MIEGHRGRLTGRRCAMRQEADAAKAEGKHDINMGRLPFLEVDGQQVPQSKSIERFVAGRYGFLGENDVQAAQIDSVCEHVRDIKDAYQKVRGIQDEAEKKAGMEKWFGTDLPEWCGKLEKVWHTHASSTRTLLHTAGVRAHALTPACAQLTPVALANGGLFSPQPPSFRC
jgi:hypothetical protein